MSSAILSSLKRLFSFKLMALMFIGACFTLLVPIVARHHKFSAQIKAKLAQVHAAGEPVTPQELNAYYAAVPPDKNAAKIYGQAFDAVRKSGSHKFLEGTSELPQGTNSLPEELRRPMENAVTNGGIPLAMLRKAADLPECRYPVDYTPGWTALLPHLVTLAACAHLETCNGVLKEQSGDTDAAIRSVVLISKYGATLNSEPDLISVLIQERIDIQAGDLARWIINHRKLSMEQLATLQQAFENIESTNWIDRIVIGDRCATLSTFEYSAADFLNIVSPSQNSRWNRLYIQFLRFTGEMKKDELSYLSTLDEIRETARLPFPERVDAANALGPDIRNRASSQELVVTGTLLPPLAKAIGRDAQHSARMRLIRTALAIEQFRLKHDQPPDTLDELTPQYLTNVLLDPFDGQALRYTKSAEGYLLYSIGPDRVDDGGRKPLPLTSKENLPEGDLTLSVHR